MEHARRERIALLVSLLAIIILAGYAPEADRLTWLLENMPVFIALPILLFTYRYFPFSRLAYLLMWLQAMVLIVGGHYTYAEMPLFNWLRDTFDMERNYYDRVGHFMQGIAPAIVAREILLRKTPLNNDGWLFVIACSVTLAFSALTNLSNGGSPCSQAPPPKPSSPPRAMYGTPSGTCSWRSSARSSANCCSAACTTNSCAISMKRCFCARCSGELCLNYYRT